MCMLGTILAQTNQGGYTEGNKFYNAANPKWGINILKPADKIYDYKIIRTAPNPQYSLADPKVCNFWTLEKGKNITEAPWDKGCWLYQFTDSCMKYEISKDNKAVESCEKTEGCES